MSSSKKYHKYDKGRFNEPVSRKKKRIEEKERQEALDKARLNILKHINKICGRHNDSVVNHQQNGKSQLVKEKETGVSEVPLEKVKEKVKEYGGGAEEVLEETAEEIRSSVSGESSGLHSELNTGFYQSSNSWSHSTFYIL